MHVCVCDYVCVDVKLHISAGGNSPSSYVTQRSYGKCGEWVHGHMNPYLHYIYIFAPLGAYKSQLGGTYILSLLFYTVNVYCDYTSIYQ